MHTTLSTLLVPFLVAGLAPQRQVQEPDQPRVGSRVPVDVSVEGLDDPSRSGEEAGGGGSLPVTIGQVRPFVCVMSIDDQATGGCLTASSIPTSGVLFPYPGINNTFSPPAFVGGGENNQANGLRSTVGGGEANTASGSSATVGGGRYNTASAHSATVGGGGGNTASGAEATVGGGGGNTASGVDTTVAGGYANTASLLFDTVGGGAYNTTAGGSATIAGGYHNTAFGRAAVGGGAYNYAVGNATIAGGYTNRATYATVGGGYANTACFYSTVGGGGSNTASRQFATVGGGRRNTVSGNWATVGGGDSNTASGYWATVPGGSANSAVGDHSFAAGRRAKADHDGAFVWGDSFDGDKASSAADEFNVYASGGVRMFTNTAATTGVLLAPGGSTWTMVSDRDAKENVEPVDARAVLDKVANLPVATWNYKDQDDSIRHMGPMAQDFYAAFGLGLGAKTIDTIDPNGVALAAIQGLNAELDELRAAKDAEIAALRAEKDSEIEGLRARLARLEAMAEAGLAK